MYVSAAAALLLLVLRVYVFTFSSVLRQFPHIRYLLENASIAIWNGNKVILVVAMMVWGINIVFLIQGKSLRPSLLQTI